MVELIVAMFIIGLVLVVLIGIQISAALTVSDARTRQEATAFGNEAIEQMRAIPWNILAKGLDSDFLTASGSDPYVDEGRLKIDGQSPVLQVATSTQDQDTSRPWPPLFDEHGSNKKERTDASNLATKYTVRAYVTQGVGGGDSTRGLAVVVEWKNHKGVVEHTTMWDMAYRGGLGCQGSTALDTQPYLGACQAMLDASSTSGSIATQVTATTIADETNPAVAVPLVGTGSLDPFYFLAMRTAGVATTTSTQQVTIVRAISQYGGTTQDDNDPATQPEQETGWQNGFNSYMEAASDDVSLSQIPPTTVNRTITPASSDETEIGISDVGSPVSFRALSDYRRTSTLNVSAKDSCKAGIPANQPCAKATISNYPVLEGGSGYILMYVDGTIFRVSRRIADISGSGANTESAWAARFITSAGTLSAVGCTTLTGEGCVSAGADRTMATLAIGTVISGSWNGNAADGMVLIEGKAGCANGLTESILVQRGASQQTTDPVATRCGAIRYWSGSNYTTFNIVDANTTAILDTTPLTWSGGDYTVTATAHITVTAASVVATGPSGCATDACQVSADAGAISVVASFTVTGPSGSYVVTGWTVVNPPQAMASYKKAPGA